MTVTEWAATVLSAAVAGGGGAWSYLKVRSSNSLQREKNAIEVLTGRLVAMESEVRTLKREAHVYRRISHDSADIANAAQLLLVTKFIEINETLLACGRPEKYPEPVKSAMDAIKQISETIVGQRQAIYDKAEALERESELKETEKVVEQEKIVQSGPNPK